MAYGSVTITANVTGGNDGTWSLGPSGSTRMLLNAIQAETVVTLAAGANTITVPSGATECIIIPFTNSGSTTNTAYSGTLTLKGASGDTGVTISSSNVTVIPWDTAPSTFVLTASAVGTISIRFL
jgi:hypothetical protein